MCYVAQGSPLIQTRWESRGGGGGPLRFLICVWMLRSLNPLARMMDELVVVVVVIVAGPRSLLLLLIPIAGQNHERRSLDYYYKASGCVEKVTRGVGQRWIT